MRANKLTNIDKNDEQIKLDANDLLLKSKAFFLSVVDSEGNIRCIVNGEDLSFVESIGFHGYIKSVANQKLQSMTSCDVDSNEEEEKEPEF